MNTVLLPQFNHSLSLERRGEGTDQHEYRVVCSCGEYVTAWRRAKSPCYVESERERWPAEQEAKVHVHAMLDEPLNELIGRYLGQTVTVQTRWFNQQATGILLEPIIYPLHRVGSRMLGSCHLELRNPEHSNCTTIISASMLVSIEPIAA